MLKSADKRVFRDVMKYFFDTTGIDYADYTRMLADVDDPAKQSEHGYYLLQRCFEVLKKKGIEPLSACIELKDWLREEIIGEQSAVEGEYYTPEQWAVKGREYLKAAMGEELWSRVNIWDMSCGMGNLVRGADISEDRIFLSTLLAEDVEVVQKHFPGATVFQMNALNGIDYDDINARFLQQLPERLQAVLLNDEPLCVFINPPYRCTNNDPTDIYYHMQANSLGCGATDLQTQFIYRLCLLAQSYKLTNFYVGLYGTQTWLCSVTKKPFSDYVFQHFRFISGFMFDAHDFNGIFQSFAGNIICTVWKKDFSVKENKPVVSILQYIDGKYVSLGTQRLRQPVEALVKWMAPRDVQRYVTCPSQTSGINFRETTASEPDNCLMHILSETTTRQAVRSASWLRFPIKSQTSVPVTPENFWRCVVGFGIQASLQNLDFTEASQILQAPDDSLEGYAQLQANCLAMFVFDLGAYAFSYRGIKTGVSLSDNYNNRLFPIPYDDCIKLISDPVLLEDMKMHPCDNSIILQALQWAAPLMSDEAKALMTFGYGYLAETLSGEVRKAAGYPVWTQAYDAGVSQLRNAKICWSDAREEEYLCLVSKLRSSIRPSAYKYGCLEPKEI